MKSTINFSSEQIILNDRYIIKDALGTGKTSTVYKCLDNQTGEEKAIKIYNNNAITEKNFRNKFALSHQILPKWNWHFEA